MKSLFIASLLLASASASQAMTVKEGDIAGKSNLVTVANVNLSGKAATILADQNGISLYTFEQDKSGVSNCSGGCLSVWPAQHAPAGSQVLAPFGTIKGHDGQLQLTLNGLPLYHHAADKKPGDTTGEYSGWDVILIQN
jgi:predicted lipoprotein with Yx(FWY)xxD motif